MVHLGVHRQMLDTGTGTGTGASASARCQRLSSADETRQHTWMRPRSSSSMDFSSAAMSSSSQF